MADPANGFEFLAKLKEENGKEFQNYKDFSGYIDFKAREKGIPVHGQFELTPLCNFNCGMCYVHLDQAQLNGKNLLSIDDWKSIVYQAWQAGMIYSTLSGGECLTYPGFEELFIYLHELGCNVEVLTNGLLLNEKRIRFFQKHMPSNIQVTLYGWNDDVYERVTGQRAYNTVTENIRKAIQADLPISISITPNAFLGKDVLETIRAGREMTKAISVNSAVFSPREETGRSKQEDDADLELYIQVYRLLQELNGRETRTISIDKLPPAGGPFHKCVEKGLRCGGGRSSFCIDWKGTIMPCYRMDMIHADVLKDGFAAAWKSINQAANNWPRVPECIKCPYDEVCNNCMGNILQYAEPGKQPIALCEKTRQYVSQGVKSIPEC